MRTTTPLIITGILCIGITLLISYLLWGDRPAPQIESPNYAPGLIKAAAKGKAASVSILNVISETNPESNPAGSGVLISQDGLIVTNYHVIAGGNRIQVQLDNLHEF